MKRRFAFVIIGIVLVLMHRGQLLRAQTISLTGSWTLTIDVSNLIGGPGTDLTDMYESAANQIVIDVSATGNTSWRVDVSKSDITWPGQFHLDVQRTGDGTGNGTVSGGLTYQEITSTDTEFYQGTKKRENVPVQLRLRGVSVVPNTYTTTVYYTVVRLW